MPKRVNREASQDDAKQAIADQILSAGPELAQEILAALREKIKKGDMKAIHLASEMLGLVKQSPLVSVVQTNNNMNVGSDGDGGGRFEAIIRRIERERDAKSNTERPIMGQRVLEVEPLEIEAVEIPTGPSFLEDD
ncbi:MAG: hypothetical protein HC888_10150 [Candidatus Competibacteraceae bacterium]|nr:hypothetical protein [Candidatus Competibacteraceae bacterium]